MAGGERYVSDIPGINSRLDPLQAAILAVKLPRLDADNARRQAIAALYDAGLAGTHVALPMRRPGASHVFHQYVVRHPKRDALSEELRARGIGTLVHYPVPVHAQAAYCGRIAIGARRPRRERARGGAGAEPADFSGPRRGARRTGRFHGQRERARGRMTGQLAVTACAR